MASIVSTRGQTRGKLRSALRIHLRGMRASLPRVHPSVETELASVSSSSVDAYGRYE
jgi:hypothetical protein